MFVLLFFFFFIACSSSSSSSSSSFSFSHMLLFASKLFVNGLLLSFNPPPLGQKHVNPKCAIPAGLLLRPGRIFPTLEVFDCKSDDALASDDDNNPSSCSYLRMLSFMLWKNLNGSTCTTAFTAVFKAHCGSPPP